MYLILSLFNSALVTMFGKILIIYWLAFMQFYALLNI